jgi:hypothetical protein
MFHALRRLWFVLLALGVLAPSVHADVTLEQRTMMTMIGGSGQGPTVLEVAGRKRREVREITFSGAIADQHGDASMFDIVRLDRGLMWRLDAEKKTYDEIPMARFAEAMRQSAGPGLDSSTLASLKKLDLKWSVTSTATGATETIAGFPATQTILTIHGEGTDPGTGTPVDLDLVTELWNSTTLPGVKELRTFDAAFAKAAGVDGAWVASMVSSLGGAGEALKLYAAERAKLPGYPIRTVARVAMPSMAKMLEALQGMMGGDAQGGAGTGGGVLMSSTTELVSVRTDPIAADRFAVPAGFKKIPSKLATKKAR